MKIEYNGLGMGLGDLARLSNAESRSISAENKTGEKGKGGQATEGTCSVYARELGQGWKVSPSIDIGAKETVVLAEIKGPGAIQHIWMTVDPDYWRCLMLRMYWDGEKNPSIEVPLGDFFCNGWCVRSNVNSLPVSVNPAGGFNCFWEMSFRKLARVTIENLAPKPIKSFFYQFDYTLTDIPEDRAYLHAQWRRSNPLEYGKVHTLLDDVRGMGHYVGAYMARGVHNNGWWGEGEIKFYIDGDEEWPTICGTGTEDYFGGAWNFEQPPGEYGIYSTPFCGLHQVIKPKGLYQSQQRFGMYRWHIQDPIRFKEDLRVTIQALGWVSPPYEEDKYLPLIDDIATTAFWYQAEPHAKFTNKIAIRDIEIF